MRLRMAQDAGSALWPDADPSAPQWLLLLIKPMANPASQQHNALHRSDEVGRIIGPSQRRRHLAVLL